jgi:hypothetical protein
MDSRLTSHPSPASIQTSYQHHMGNLPLQMNSMGMGSLPASLSFAQQPSIPLSSGFPGYAKPTSGFVSSSSSHRDVIEDISNDEGNNSNYMDKNYWASNISVFFMFINRDISGRRSGALGRSATFHTEGVWFRIQQQQ